MHAAHKATDQILHIQTTHACEKGIATHVASSKGVVELAELHCIV